jgi:hypothetical protein
MMITNPEHYFERPTQVKFFDPHLEKPYAGIAYKNEVICGCCGTIYAVKTLAKTGIETLDWVDLVEEIIGE